MRPRARIAIAAGLVALGFGAPIGFMWLSGRAAAEAERARILAEPLADARAAAERIARRVTNELTELAEREGQRPYYQWQSLIVDPRGAYDGEAVVPSVLAEGPTEPLVLTHFQLDERGRVTSPEVNEAKGAPPPKPAALERLMVLRSALAGRRAEPPLLASADPVDDAEPVQVAIAAQPPSPSSVQVANVAPATKTKATKQQAKPKREAPDDEVQVADAGDLTEQKLSKQVYLQNASAPEIYEAIQQNKSSRRDFEPGQVTVRVGPFEWETLRLGGVGAGDEAMVATRVVETPDAPKLQGFVVDGEKLATLLADGEVTASLAPPEVAADDVLAVAPLNVPGLDRVVVVPLPDPAAVREAAAVPIDEFHLRSILLTLFAFLAAAAIVLLAVQTERLLERRQRFAAAAAHELRTPLAGLRMYAEMLAHGLGKPERRRTYAERLADEAARLGRVVSNVLDFTRLERKTLAVLPTEQDIGALSEEIVTKLEPSLVTAGAHLVFERPSRPVIGRVDADALAQILGNLVDNAEKYSREADDRTITVSVIDGSSGPEVHVRDRGPGLPEPRRLFRPFTRGPAKDGPAGLGLGLALARALARAQGGDLVTVDRDPGAELVVRFAR